jgi:hypothetical protein
MSPNFPSAPHQAQDDPTAYTPKKLPYLDSQLSVGDGFARRFFTVRNLCTGFTDSNVLSS